MPSRFGQMVANGRCHAVASAEQPAVDRPAKTMSVPSERRDVKTSVRIAKVEGGPERPRRMQREIACFGKARPAGKAEAVAQSALQRRHHQTRIAHRQRPVTEALAPCPVRRQRREHVPGRDEAASHQFRRKLALRSQYRESCDQNARIRHQGAIIAPFRPQQRAILVGGERRFENIAPDRALDLRAFARCQLVVEPIVGQRHGDGNFGAIEKGADDRPFFPARGCGKFVERIAGRRQRRLGGGAIGGERDERSRDQAPCTALERSAQVARHRGGRDLGHKLGRPRLQVGIGVDETANRRQSGAAKQQIRMLRAEGCERGPGEQDLRAVDLYEMKRSHIVKWQSKLP